MKFALTKKALLASAVSSALLATANVATAADLDSLSDDDLLARIEALEKAIEGKGNVVLNGNKKVKLKISGQVNQKLRYANDGTESQVNILDNDASSTRLRLDGEAKVAKDFKVKSKIEFDLEVNPSDEVDIRSAGAGFFRGDDIGGPAGAGTSAQIDLRRAEIAFDHKRFGKLTLGQTNTASNGVIERDLSGATLAVGDASADDDDISFAFSATGVLLDGAGGDAEIGDFIDPNDGNSRAPAIRYDTPRFYGFSIATSFVQERTYDVALDYRNKDLAGFSVAGRAAYNAFDNSQIADAVSDQTTQASGSLSILHNATGLNLTGYVGGDIDDGTREAAAVAAGATNEYFFWGIKGGIKGKVFSLGSSAFAVDYGRGSGVADPDEIGDIGSLTLAQQVTVINNASSDTIGVQFTQKWDKASAELYAGWRRYDIDLGLGAAFDTDAINVVTAGSRFKF